MDDLDRAVDEINALFDEMLAGKGDSGNLKAYNKRRTAIIRSHGLTEKTLRSGSRAKLEAFAQANTHGIRNIRPPEEE